MQELIDLAKQKGFEENLGFQDDVNHLLTYSEKWKYIWLNLLGKWLYDTHSIHITINPSAVDGEKYYYHIDQWVGTEMGFHPIKSGFGGDYFETPMICLYFGIEKALKTLD